MLVWVRFITLEKYSQFVEMLQDDVMYFPVGAYYGVTVHKL